MGTNDSPSSPRGIFDAFPHQDDGVVQVAVRKIEEILLRQQQQGEKDDALIDVPTLRKPAMKTSIPLTIEIPSTSKSTHYDALQSRIGDVQKQIQLVKEQCVNNKAEYQDRLLEAKMEYQRKMYQELGLSSYPTFVRDKNHQTGRKLAVTQKEMKSLKTKNSRLRRDIAAYRRDLMDPFISSNQKMELAHRKAEDQCAALIQHIVKLQEAQKRLQDTCDSAKSQLLQMRRDYLDRRSHHKAEANSCKAYETCLAKILSRKSTKGALKDNLFETAEEGWGQAYKVRSEVLAPRGLELPPTPSKKKLSSLVNKKAVQYDFWDTSDEEEDGEQTDETDSGWESDDNSTLSSGDELEVVRFKWGDRYHDDTSSTSWSDGDDSEH